MVPETYGWNDYWQKLATQAAGQQPARPDPDGLPLHLRIRAPPAARGPRRLHRQAARPRRLRPEPARLRQGRRQALRRLDGRQLDELRLQQGAARQARRRRCPTRPPGPTTTSSAIGKEVKDKLPDGMFFIAEHGLRRAAARDLGAPARQGALHRGRPARLRARGPDRLLRLLEGPAGQGPDAARRRPEPGRRGKMEDLDARDRQVALRLHPLEPARRQPEAGARRDQHHDDPEPDGRQAGPVPEALDAALDRRDLAATRRRRPS